ncbi:hypothetical protein CYMTET_46882 [Cymbomonas tetramitiformis]|uniref:Uncharacterized protein n=1 Tax=Cymbomonas tetramitiformis TaxID=36881 RepID=A0AAE0BWH3_9CHLO|nr:hypothetical protein CYMTET_46882 [Cymbomonas tetramitiformis]
MCNSRAVDQLAKKPSLSLYYKHKTLAPMLSVLLHAKDFNEQAEAHTVQGVCRNMCNWHTSYALRGRFLELGVSKAEARRVRETVTKTVHRLGIEQIEQEEGRVGTDAVGGAFGFGDGHRRRKVQGDPAADLKDPGRCETPAEQRAPGAVVGGGCWVPARELPRFNGPCQAVDLAVPPARSTCAGAPLGACRAEQLGSSRQPFPAGMERVVAPTQRGKPVEWLQHFVQPHHRAPAHGYPGGGAHAGALHIEGPGVDGEDAKAEDFVGPTQHRARDVVTFEAGPTNGLNNERLSWDRDVDDWRLNRRSSGESTRWADWAQKQRREHTVDRLLFSGISAQMPKVSLLVVGLSVALLARREQLGEPVVGATGSDGPQAASGSCNSDDDGATLARAALVQSLEVLASRRKDADAWCPGSITRVSGDWCHVSYADGDEEDFQLRSETFRPLLPQVSGGEPQERDSALGDQWRAQLREHPGTELEESLLLYAGSLLQRGTVAAGSTQPHLSAINNEHEGLEFDGPAEGNLEGAASLQAQVLADAGQQEAERTWLPAEAVARVQGVQDAAVSSEHVTFALRKEKGRQQVPIKQQSGCAAGSERDPGALGGVGSASRAGEAHRQSLAAPLGEPCSLAGVPWGHLAEARSEGNRLARLHKGATSQGTVLRRVQQRVHGQSECPLSGRASLMTGGCHQLKPWQTNTSGDISAG